MTEKTAIKTLRPSAAFIEEVRKVLSVSPDAPPATLLLKMPAWVYGAASFSTVRDELLAQIGWALAEIAAIEDAERLPGSPFGKHLTQALKDAPDFEPAPLRPILPPMQYVTADAPEAPVMTFWREAYRAAIGALIDPTLHGSTTSGVNVRAKEIADQAAFDFFETERTGLAEIAVVARGARKEPRQ